MPADPVDPAVLGPFLAGRYIATIATYRRDGTAQLTANWYLVEDGAVHLPTFPTSVKARNVQRDPRAAVMVDSRGPGPLRGAATNGPAELLEGPEALALNERCWERYLTPAGLADPRIGGLLRAHDVVCVRVRARRWSWWDNEVIFGELLQSPEYVHPLSP